MNELMQRFNGPWKKILYLVQYIIMIGVFVYLFVWIKEVKLVSVNIGLLMVSVMCILLMRTISVFRFIFLLKKFLYLDRVKAIVSQLIGISLGLVTPGKLGESYKVFSLGKDSLMRKKLFAIFLFEKMMDAAMYSLFGLYFALKLGTYLKETLILLGFFTLGVIVYFLIQKKVPFSIIGFFKPTTLILSVLMFMAFISSFWIFVNSAGLSLDFLSAAYVITIASVIAIISNLPGGLGARELTGTVLLSNVAQIDVSLAGVIVLMHTLMNYSTTWISTIIVKLILRK